MSLVKVVSAFKPEPRRVAKADLPQIHVASIITPYVGAVKNIILALEARSPSREQLVPHALMPDASSFLRFPSSDWPSRSRLHAEATKKLPFTALRHPQYAAVQILQNPFVLHSGSQ